MRVVVALLLVIGFGMLKVSSVTGTVVWGWVAAGLGLAAFAVLIADSRRKWAASAGSEAEFEDGPHAGMAAAAPSTQGEPLPAPADRDVDADPEVTTSRDVRSSSVAGSAEAPDPAGRLVDDAADTHLETPVRAAGPGRAGEAAAEGAGGSPAGVSEVAASEPVGRSSRPEGSRPGDQSAVGGSADVVPSTRAGVPDTRSGVASWFTPPSRGGQARSGSGDDGSLPGPGWKHTEQGGSDATVVFSRLRADGAATTGSAVLDGVSCSRESGDAREGDRGPSTAAVIDDEVLVIDELPGYHLAGCGALDGRATIALTTRDAVELGFIPCAACVLVGERAVDGPGAERVREKGVQARPRT